MNPLKPMRLEWRLIFGFAVLSLLTLSFQNCGTGFDGTAGTEPISTDKLALKYGQDANKVSTAPFAFNATFDQIAYSSCYQSKTNDSNSIFSIRAGAYRNGGVTLKRDFLNYVDKNFKPIHPNKTISAAQYKEILADSPENKNIQLRMALRAPQNYQFVRSFSGTPVEGIEYFRIGPTLSQDYALTQLVQYPDLAIRYFKLAPNTLDRQVEASLYLNSDEGYSQSLRDSFRNDAFLGLTYSDLNNVTGARAPTGNTNQQIAYGVGYRLSFASGLHLGQVQIQNTNQPGLYSFAPDNILVQINETNLDGSTGDLRQWTCDSNRRYLIVRRADAATYCPPENFSDYASSVNGPAYLAELALLRRQLPADEWDINIGRRCVVPKIGSCYLEGETYNNNTVQVEYNQSKECYHSAIKSGTHPTNRCPQFLSICLRE